jgi:hypothetical protein
VIVIRLENFQFIKTHHSTPGRSGSQRGCTDRMFVLKFGQQIKTIYRLACLDCTSPGQAKMGSRPVKSVRNRGWAHNPKVPSSNLGPATRKGTAKCLFRLKTDEIGARAGTQGLWAPQVWVFYSLPFSKYF